MPDGMTYLHRAVWLVADDVGVGEDEAVAVDDEAGAVGGGDGLTGEVVAVVEVLDLDVHQGGGHLKGIQIEIKRLSKEALITYLLHHVRNEVVLEPPAPPLGRIISIARVSAGTIRG